MIIQFFRLDVIDIRFRTCRLRPWSEFTVTCVAIAAYADDYAQPGLEIEDEVRPRFANQPKIEKIQRPRSS